MDSRDERDAESILLTIESEFRRTLEAEQTFMAWRRDTPNAPFAERLRRYAAWAEASEPFATSYRRISTVSVDQINAASSWRNIQAVV